MLSRGYYLCDSRLVCPVDAVCRCHKLFLAKTGDVSTGVVVRRVRNSECACAVDQLIAGEGMTERGVIMLALTDKVELAILTDSVVAVRTYRSGILVLSLSECVGGRTVGTLSKWLDDLLAYEREKS